MRTVEYETCTDPTCTEPHHIGLCEDDDCDGCAWADGPTMATTGELLAGIKALATEALGRVQAAQSDRRLYDLLLDLNAAVDELTHRDPEGRTP